jgi:hypothetical protein
LAVGFPRWKRDGNRRRSAQIDGAIPTGEGLESIGGRGLQLGFLTLVGNRKPARVIKQGPIMEAGTTTPWGGMSGAVVVADGQFIVGVVRSVNLAADGQSLTVTPLTAIENLADDARKKAFWDALGISSPEELTQLPERRVSSARVSGYEYDVYVSYWPSSYIESWVRNRFIKPFKDLLLEELGRQAAIFIPRDSASDIPAVSSSRVLLGVLSKQYFYQESCRVVFESMLQRQMEEEFGTSSNPVRLVHAIIAHDFTTDESVPVEYRGSFHPLNFKEWAYDFEIQDWRIYTSFADAIGHLASDVAEAVTHAPAWRADFPLRIPTAVGQPVVRRPLF